MSRNVQFITDAEGNRTAVILPMDEYEQLMEDLHLARIYEESRDEERIPWDQIKEELIAEGKLER
jgi:PHD/YefM family antitoxin component YafN of YafNO toxin-antitoxin module